MKVLRTPEENFNNLPGYDFEANYIQVSDDIRMHYVDEGPKDAEVVLLLHGEPSWSYLYRKMIPVLAKAGYRTIAPDLIGFGKSDKPGEQSDYTYQKHLDWLEPIFRDVCGAQINMFVQDWGGLLGLRLAEQYDDKIKRIVVGNSMLPIGYPPANEAFLQWRKFSQVSPKFDCGLVLSNATVSDLSPEVVAAYNAPFPDDSYKAGARIFPSLVPIDPDEPEAVKNKQCWEYYKQFKKPFLTLFSDTDPITKGGDKYFQKVVPGTEGMPHEIIKAGGHFLQEDKGVEIAQKMISFFAEH